MKQLKIIAKKWNVVIVLLVQIAQHNEQMPPTLQDIKNSSDIIQESDMVIMIWRKNALHNKIKIYENKTLISIQANRRSGKNGNVGMIFDSETGRYYEENSWVEAMEEEAKREFDTSSNFEVL